MGLYFPHFDKEKYIQYTIGVIAQEKQDLYHFFSVVDSYLNKTPLCNEVCLFKDDTVLNPKITTNSAQTSSTFQDDTVLNPKMALEAIAEKVCKCQQCSLSSTRNHVVCGEGVKDPLVLVIGEAPGADEDKSGLPFVGKAGQLLDKMLLSISLSRQVNCFIGNCIKCRPPENRDPTNDELIRCSPFLQAQIALLQPNVILCLGRIAMQHLLQTQDSIGKLHGRFFDYKGIPLMPTYHPSALLRNEEWKRPAWEDLKLFRTRLLDIYPTYQQDFNQLQAGLNANMG